MNHFIGEPNEALKNYTKSENRRAISDMTTEECRLILDIAHDNDAWNQLAVSEVEIQSAHDNFVEGIGYLSNKSTAPFEFTIRYDGTVGIFRTMRDRNTNKIIKIKQLNVSNFAGIILVMMKMNFDVTKHLEKN